MWLGYTRSPKEDSPEKEFKSHPSNSLTGVIRRLLNVPERSFPLAFLSGMRYFHGSPPHFQRVNDNPSIEVSAPSKLYSHRNARHNSAVNFEHLHFVTVLGIYEQVFAFFPFFLTISRLRKHSAIHADESSLEHYSQVAHLHTTSEDDFVVVWFGALGRS